MHTLLPIKGLIITMSYDKVTQSCLSLWNPMDCNLPVSSVHGILQARVLEWIAMPFSRALFQPRDWTLVSCITSRFFTIWAPREGPRPWWFRLCVCGGGGGPSWVLLVVKNPSASAGDMRPGFDPWVRKFPWRRAWGNPLQYSRLKNPVDRGA